MNSEEYAVLLDEYLEKVERKFFRGEMDEDTYGMITLKLFEWLQEFKRKEAEE